jgi:hypothetical protein
MSAEAAATTRISPLRVAVASFIGTTVEFYDLLIYGTAAALVPLAASCSAISATDSAGSACWCIRFCC